MFRRAGLIISTFALACLAGCGSSTHQEQDLKTAPSLRVVNVLDEALFQDAHIKGSTHLNYTDFLEKVRSDTLNWDKADTVVFYCSNYLCTASFEAARELKKQGFENVMAYEGGMAEWSQLSEQDPSFAVEGKKEQAYLKEVTPKPEHAVAGDVTIVSAQDLKKMMQDKNLL